jgi:VWFA-related protein
MRGKTTSFFLAFLLWLSQGVISSARMEPAQTKPATQDQQVRLKANLLELRVVVTDRQGRLIDTLTKEDFEVLENDRPQQIAFFSVERIGADAGVRVSPSRSPKTGTRAAGPPSSPVRTVVLCADTLHLSAASLLHAKQALKRFVDQQITDQDLVQIVTTGGSLGLLGQFTQNRQMLRYAIDKLTPWRASARETLFAPYLAGQVDRGDPDAVGAAIAILTAEEGPGVDDRYARARARQILQEAAGKRTATLATLKAVAEQLAGLPGQRILAFISDGFSLVGFSGGFETNWLNSAISRAVRSGVVIYSLDAKGLQPDVFFDASLPGINLSPALIRYVSDSRADLQNGLNALASDTGGKAFFNTNDLNLGLQRALDENRVYYLLSYYPADEKDRRFRRLTVRVKNHPEYSVRLPKGYLPEDLKKEKEQAAKTPQGRLLQAVAAPLPSGGLGVAASANYLEFETDEAKISLQVHIDGDNLQYREQEQGHVLQLEMATVVYDSSGKPVNTFIHNIHGNLRSDRIELAKQYGYRYEQRIDVKPGLYQLRVGVREVGTERIGTGVAWVDVPELKRKRLTLSSLFIGQQEPQGRLLASQGFESVQGEAIRRLKKGNALAYFLMIYNASAPPEELTMQVAILSGQTEIYKSEWQPVSSRTTGQDKKGMGVAGQLVLTDVEPGIYELRVAIKEPKLKKPVHQSAAFEVEP